MNEYRQLVEKVRKYIKAYGDGGFSLAIEYCIEHNILKDYLTRNIEEVKEMFSNEYSYELELEASRYEGRKEGMEGVACVLKEKDYNIDEINEIIELSKKKMKIL